MFEVGSLIRQKREAAGYSLKKLASISGISDSELYKIENGTRQSPNWRTLCEIAKALDIHPFELLLKAGYINDADIAPVNKIKRLDRLSAESLRLVQLYVDFLITVQDSITTGKGDNHDF